jgi:hypothetical protein
MSFYALEDFLNFHPCLMMPLNFLTPDLFNLTKFLLPYLVEPFLHIVLAVLLDLEENDDLEVVLSEVSGPMLNGSSQDCVLVKLNGDLLLSLLNLGVFDLASESQEGLFLHKELKLIICLLDGSSFAIFI